MTVYFVLIILPSGLRFCCPGIVVEVPGVELRGRGGGLGLEVVRPDDGVGPG